MQRLWGRGKPGEMGVGLLGPGWMQVQAVGYQGHWAPVVSRAGAGVGERAPKLCVYKAKDGGVCWLSGAGESGRN